MPWTAYADWVRENADQAKKLEEMARVGSMIAPKGEHYADVLTELSYSVLGLVGLVNDTIIHGKTKRAGEVFAHPVSHQQQAVHMVRALLTFFAHFETFLEVAVTKWASAQRDRLVVGIELIKAAARAYLLLMFPGECIVAGGKFESHVEEPAANAAAAAAPAPEPEMQEVAPGSVYRGKRTGVALAVPAGMMRLAQNQRIVPPVTDTSLVIGSELLHLLRPLVVVFAPRTRFWTALAFGMDILALRLLQASKASAEEVRRRALLLIFYLFRTPVYEHGLGEFAAYLRTFKDTKGLGMLGELIAFQIDFYHKTHFYSAAS